MKETEQHPWVCYAPQGATTLLIGTFPPTKRNWSYDFFYPNKNNLFWRIIATVSGHTLLHFKGEAAVNERKQLLDDLRIAITDMGLTILRNNGSSLDENLELVIPMDILNILDQYPTISKIVLTSSSGKASALGWFKQYLFTKAISIVIKSGKKPLYTTLNYQGRMIDVVVLFSPSARAANRITFDALVAMYRDVLIKG
jgi:G:T/U-mismatch repair DNA glycosylase